MCYRFASAKDGHRDDLFALVLSGVRASGDEPDIRKLRAFTQRVCAADGNTRLAMREVGGVAIAYCAGTLFEHPWLPGKELSIFGLWGRGGLKCLEMVEEWGLEGGLRDEMLTLNPDKRYDRWARSRGAEPIVSYRRPRWR